jgi:hypothetical protein
VFQAIALYIWYFLLCSVLTQILRYYHPTHDEYARYLETHTLSGRATKHVIAQSLAQVKRHSGPLDTTGISQQLAEASIGASHHGPGSLRLLVSACFGLFRLVSACFGLFRLVFYIYLVYFCL